MDMIRLNKVTYLLIIVGSLFLFSFSPLTKEHEKEKILYDEITKDLKCNILPFWVNYSVDKKGGFCEALAYDGSPIEGADKGCVLNARILWTFSLAYQVFEDSLYLDLANRAQHYFIEHFIDKELGGTYWTLSSNGTPKDKDKQTYGIAYAIYGLSEHYRATQNQESLDEAIALYHCLENRAFDSENGGYIESFTKDWQKPNKYGYDGDGIASKTMNTHIHLLEAYTNLYQVWKDDGLREQLTALIDVLMERVYNSKTHHLMLYFNDTWDSLEDIDSYGHDIETAWLFNEAANTLGDAELIKRTNEIAIEIVNTTMEQGMNPDGSFIYERKGNYFRRDLSWWCQAEAVNGLLDAWQISRNVKYLDAAINTWSWIKSNMVDHKYGEWYRSVSATGDADLERLKASLWRCPYHNSRMGFRIISFKDVK